MPVALHSKNVPKQYKAEYTSYQENSENVPVIDKISMDQFFELAGVDLQDEASFAGLDADAHKLFPPTYICTCEFDPLRDDGKILAKALEKAGTKVKYDNYDGLPHCFFYFPKLPETQVFMSKTFAGIKWVFENM